MHLEKITDIDAIKHNHPHLATVSCGWVVDSTYRVLLANTGKYTHLRIRRLDDLPVSSFSDMQNIKNAILGPDVIAIQVFPRESDYVNNSNTYICFKFGTSISSHENRW